MEAVGSVMTNKYSEGYPGEWRVGFCSFVLFRWFFLVFILSWLSSLRGSEAGRGGGRSS